MNRRRLKNEAKDLFSALITIIIIFAVAFCGINLYVVSYSNNYIYAIDEIEKLDTHQAAMALGAKVWDSGTLSYILRDRVNYASKLYESGKAERLLFSGDHGTKGYDEVNAMLEHAVSQGVPIEDIFLDHAGFSTYESMYRAADIFECDDLIIVTQEFHLYRSVYTARKMGINAIGIKSDQTNFVARIDIKNNLREFLARVKDFFYVEIIKPEPTYLGRAIPINGDAELTHDK